GYGDPIQKLFKFDDGERVIAAFSLDPRLPRPENLIAVSRRGFGLRFALAPHAEISTRSGRRYARPAKDDELLGVSPVGEKDLLTVVTEKTYALVCKASEVNELSGPGKGVVVIKLAPDDKVMAFLVGAKKDGLLELELETEKGRTLSLSPGKYEVSARGGKGREMSKKDRVKGVSMPIQWVPLPEKSN
ncbi:MAG TPA: DNA gyrase C-terminal beta-propeller domain-containing protein, partial [Myxococcaceae bacterium]|nr:DNA gyrase C-terminal beta-propeller domain-containing protein [Myxococcaceae bacterium]